MRKKEASMSKIFWIMTASFLIAIFWDQLTFIRNIVGFIFDPTAGVLLNWNLLLGMIILTIILTLFSSLAQKFLTDQSELKRLKEEQKRLQTEMKKFQHHPEKALELQKELLPLTGKMMKVSMGAMAYTSIPIILLFRWFHSFFDALGNPAILWGITWFWFYFILTLILSSVFRKVLKVA